MTSLFFEVELKTQPSTQNVESSNEDVEESVNQTGNEDIGNEDEIVK